MAPFISLPFNSVQITRRDLQKYRPIFALYLDIQKNLSIEDLPHDEVRGRWKSFVGKWNRGELAEGWYDPKILEKATAFSTTTEYDFSDKGHKPKRGSSDHGSDEVDYGPALPGEERSLLTKRTPSGGRAPGPAIPNMQDLQVKRELAEEETAEQRHGEWSDLRDERRADSHAQKEQLDELVPKAEAGSRERQLEKKREKAESNRAFATSREEHDVELRDADVMGEEDSLSNLKRMKRDNERKKNEREIRREEVLRARRTEREGRVSIMREKEEKTMSMLKELAKARFAGGS